MKPRGITLTLLGTLVLSPLASAMQIGQSQASPGASNRVALRMPAVPDCNAVDLVPSQVLLTWPDCPTEDTLAAAAGGNTALLVQNVGSQALTYDLKGLLVADGQRLELSLGSGALGAGSAVTLPVTLTGYGVSLFDLDFSGSLIVQSAIRDSAGTLVERTYSRVVFFHQDVSGAVFLYGREARHSLFFAGDLKNRFFSSTPPDHVMGVFDGGIGVGSEAEDFGPPGVTPPEDNGQWEFCMRWVYQSIDSGFGEDYYQQGQYMKARGMKVMIDHPNWASPQIFYGSKDNGCFTFSATENSDFEVTIFAEALLGTNDNIAIQSFDTQAQAANDEMATWYQVFNPGGVPRRVYLQNEASEESSIMAFGSFVFHWVDSHTVPGMQLPKTLKLMTDNPSCEGSCQPYNTVEIKPGAGNRKFLLGHEVGHWIHRKWATTLGMSNAAYDDNAGGQACEFDGVGSHAMRSREKATGAFIEGFAHFLSAIAWNDHNETEGWFKYYKEVDEFQYADMQADNWRIDLEGNGANPSGGVSAWMETQCVPLAGHSVEMDWLRFYWDYRTVSAVLLPRPTHWEVFKHISYTRNSYGWDDYNVYDQLRQAIDDVSLNQVHTTRWEVFAGINGMDY